MLSGGSERISARRLHPTTAWVEEMAKPWEPWLLWLRAAALQPRPCWRLAPLVTSSPGDMGPEVAGLAPVAVKQGGRWDSTH